MASTQYPSADEQQGARRWLAPALIVLVLVGVGALIASQMGKGSGAPKRQTVKIAVLPDTPPPPPPPKEEKKPEPKPEENKPQPQEQPKPVEAPPEAQQLKMEGAAGDGPSAFTAGTVRNEYRGGEIGGGAGGTLADRMAGVNYGNVARRELGAFLSRDDEVRRAGDYRVSVALWLNPDGSVARWQLLGSTGQAQADEALKKALSRFKGFRAAPPANLNWPMRLQLTNRMTG